MIHDVSTHFEENNESKVAQLRCAIYTRKSTDDGLDQPFNSLEAQRESGEAYVLSQRHAGWSVVADHYDDGGYTGAHLDRPALRKLMVDMEAGRIDCVVVYKVDRLSRSLLDFARLMDVLDRHHVSLVSVTQPLNTTMSLGRLTLNILLSFAQFEREIIAERTRDKMTAARKKGQWMGGNPVLGYDVAPGGGRLVVNDEEAQRVRAIFALYLERRSLTGVLAALQGLHWGGKARNTKGTTPDSKTPFTKATIERLLRNPLYIGRVRHQGQTYAGEHSGIVEECVWQEVQKRLAEEELGKSRRGGRIPNTNPKKAPPQRAPRIARLMALALKLEQMIERAVVSDYTELARLGRVARSRITQIMNLLNLAPDIQEEILFLNGETAERLGICEKRIRRLSSVLLWKEQRARWKALLREDPEDSQ